MKIVKKRLVLSFMLVAILFTSIFATNTVKAGDQIVSSFDYYVNHPLYKVKQDVVDTNNIDEAIKEVWYIKDGDTFRPTKSGDPAPGTAGKEFQFKLEFHNLAPKAGYKFADAVTINIYGIEAQPIVQAAKPTSDGKLGGVMVSTNVNGNVTNVFKAPVYTWSADNMTCKAVKECTNDPQATVTETVTITKRVIKAATEKEAGKMEYKATFVGADFDPQTKVIVIPKIVAAGNATTRAQAQPAGTTIATTANKKGTAANAQVANKANVNKTNARQASTVNTGNESMAKVWIILAIAAVSAIVATIVALKKRERN